MQRFAKWYQPVTQSCWHKAQHVQLLICDVDGVFSDGRIYMGNAGEELKAFHTRDGYGIKALQSAGIQVAVITGRQSHIVENRMAALGVEHIYQGIKDKQAAFEDLLHQTGMKAEQCAYIGDDLIDWPVMSLCSLGVAVADAHPWLRDNADYITLTPGGRGSVRELCDLLLLSQGEFDQAQGLSI